MAVVRDDACQAGQHDTSSAWQVLPDRGNENSSPSVSSGAAFAALHSTATDVVKVVELRAATAAAEGAVDAAAVSPAAAAGVTLPLPASAVPKEAEQQHGALLTQVRVDCIPAAHNVWSFYCCYHSYRAGYSLLLARVPLTVLHTISSHVYVSAEYSVVLHP